MNGEPNNRRGEARDRLWRLSPIQLAIAGLACALIVVILMLALSVFRNSG